MKYQKLFDTTIENGGATWNPRTDKYLRVEDGGFIVGEVDGTYKTVHRDVAASAKWFDNFVEQTIVQFPNALIGTWVDGENVIHIDPVRRFGSKEVAVGFGLARKQEAIYDVAAGKVIGLR